MQASKVFSGIILSLVLTSNVYAVNKTHIMDTLGAGNNRVITSFGIDGGSSKSSFLLSGSTTPIDSNGKSSGYLLSVNYALGITDRLDISIYAPLVRNSKSTSDSGTGYTYTSKYEGQGDVAFRAQYLLLDKQQDQVSWNVSIGYSPSTAPSDSSTAEVTLNGTVITPGKTGKSGRGFAQKSIDTAFAIPASIGDVILFAGYTINGEETSGGYTTKYGDMQSVGIYLESMIGERITLTPAVYYSRMGSSTYGTQVGPSYNSYGLALGVTHDVSKSFSLRASITYSRQGENTYTDNSGNRFTYSANGYGLAFSTLFFF